MKRGEEAVKEGAEAAEARLREEIVDDVLEALRRGDLNPEDIEMLEALPEKLPRRWPLVPIPIPWLIQASGLYEWKLSFPLPYPIPIPQRIPIPIPGPGPIRPGRADGAVEEEAPEAAAELFPIFFLREELRLDIDGRYPQMVASGTLYSGLSMQVHWIANLVSSGSNTYTGTIWYKDGNTSSFPYTNVKVEVVKSIFSSYRKAKVTFTGGGASRVRTYSWTSSYFHPDEFEYDTVAGTSAVTSIAIRSGY